MDLTNLSAKIENHLTDGDRSVLVEFSTPECGPCVLQERLVNAASVDVATQAEVAKIDLNEHPDLAEKFGVRTVPTVLVLNGGKVTARFSGLIDRGSIVAAIQDA